MILLLFSIKRLQQSPKADCNSLASFQLPIPDQWRSVLLTAFCTAMAIALSRTGGSSSSSPAMNETFAAANTNCAYVPGAGFSGFPFAIGSLQFVPDPTNIDYYCFSAGCLAATASLAGITAEEVCDIAVESQDKWKNGTISRFQFVETVVDELVKGEVFDQESLSKMNIITAIPRWWGLETVARTPKSPGELKEMLKQTTWIPGVTGDSMLFNEHMDGAFTSIYKTTNPFCPNQVALPTELSWDGLDFFANSLNMGLEREKFWKFITLGNRYSVF